MGETMRERLARVRCWQHSRAITEDGGDPMCDDCREKESCQRVGEFPWWMLNEAGELLAEISEPTEEMLAAALNSQGYDRDSFHTEIDVIWRDMIDEASK